MKEILNKKYKFENQNDFENLNKKLLRIQEEFEIQKEEN